MARVSVGELWIDSTDAVEWDSDGWAVITAEPEGFQALPVHLSPSVIAKLANHKNEILRSIADTD